MLTKPPSPPSDLVRLITGNCFDVLPTLKKNSIDSCVTDPPYMLNFMNEGWDSPDKLKEALIDKEFMPVLEAMHAYGMNYNLAQVFYFRWAKMMYRVLKPGAHLVAFGGTRTFHRMVVALEDAGFEIRDTLLWMYGASFPKGREMGRAMDKEAGVMGTYGDFKNETSRKMMERGALNLKAPGSKWWKRRWMTELEDFEHAAQVYIPATEEGKKWNGWNTTLKPAFEPIVLARKALDEPTIAANLKKWGVGAMRIEACRLPTDDFLGAGVSRNTKFDKINKGWDRPWRHDPNSMSDYADRNQANAAKAQLLGRWPPNVLHDGSPEVLEAFSAFNPGSKSNRKVGTKGLVHEVEEERTSGSDSGGYPAKFFPCFKYTEEERRYWESRRADTRFYYSGKANSVDRKASREDKHGSEHPTIKPVSLMLWLIKLVTPNGGLVIDPFAGTATTLAAAYGVEAREFEFRSLGIEVTPQWQKDARERLRLAPEDDRRVRLRSMIEEPRVRLR